MTTNRAAKNAARNLAAETGRSYTAARRESAAPWLRGINAAAPGTFPFGVNDAGEVVALEPATGPHLLLAGPTGVGKSNAVRIIAYAALTHGAEVVIIDPVANGVNYEFARPYATAFATDPQSIQSALEMVEFRSAQTSTAPLIVICDDFAVLAALEGTIRRHVMTSLANIARRGQSAGICLIMVTQRSDAVMMGDLPGGSDLTDNMSRLVLGPMPSIMRSVVLRDPDSAPAPSDLQRGDGLWEPATARHASVVHTWYASQEDLAAALKQRLEPRVVTTTHLVPTYTEYGCSLRYTETHGNQTHETLVHDPDVVARAHAGALPADELHRLTGSPLPVPRDAVELDMDAAEGLSILADHNEVMLRITSQLRGSVGLLLDNTGGVAGAWMRPISLDQDGTPAHGTRDDVAVLGYEMRPEVVGAGYFTESLEEVFMDVSDECLIYAMNRQGVRVVYSPNLNASDEGGSDDLADIVKAQLRDDDVALVASPSRINTVHDVYDVQFALRGRDNDGTEKWATCGDSYYVSRYRDDTVASHVLTNDVRFMPTNATDMTSFGRLPILGQDVEVGRSVQVLGLNKWWWKVGARDDRYIVLTRGSMYGVIDLSWNITYNGVTPGPAMSSLDTLGGGWGDIEHPETILEALRTGQAEISHRRVVAVEGLVVR